MCDGAVARRTFICWKLTYDVFSTPMGGICPKGVISSDETNGTCRKRPMGGPLGSMKHTRERRLGAEPGAERAALVK